MKKFIFLDHTADAAIKAYGKDLNELFINSAVGMFSLMIDLKQVRGKRDFPFELQAEQPEELLNKWLNELLYTFEIEKLIFKYFYVEICEKNNIYLLKGKARGEEFDPNKHIINAEIKMVTFHQMKIEKINDIYQTKIVFDL